MVWKLPQSWVPLDPSPSQVSEAYVRLSGPVRHEICGASGLPPPAVVCPMRGLCVSRSRVPRSSQCQRRACWPALLTRRFRGRCRPRYKVLGTPVALPKAARHGEPEHQHHRKAASKTMPSPTCTCLQHPHMLRRRLPSNCICVTPLSLNGGPCSGRLATSLTTQHGCWLGPAFRCCQLSSLPWIWP